MFKRIIKFYHKSIEISVNSLRNTDSMKVLATRNMDGMKVLSKTEWMNTWKGTDMKFIPACFSSTYGPSGICHEGWQWIRGEKIYVFREPTVCREAMAPVIQGIRSLIERIGLNIEIVDFDTHPSIREAVSYAIREGNVIDGHAFGSFLIEEPSRDEGRGGTPHADVLLTDRSLALGRENWGESYFNTGVIIMSLSQNRQRNYDFITNVSMHETVHLLGLPVHHDHYDNDFKFEGYPKVADCLMNWEASTREICPRCEDAIRSLWEGLREGILPDSLFKYLEKMREEARRSLTGQDVLKFPPRKKID